jgi:transcriptional regulator with XRE-family HTH domain
MHVSRSDAKGLLSGIGSEIRHRRQKLGISQDVLATKAGVHCNVIGRTERGTYNPTVLKLDAIAAALNVSIVDLLRGAFK